MPMIPATGCGEIPAWPIREKMTRSFLSVDASDRTRDPSSHPAFDALQTAASGAASALHPSREQTLHRATASHALSQSELQPIVRAAYRPATALLPMPAAPLRLSNLPSP